MKISSDPGMVSALETWLRNSEGVGTPETQQSAIVDDALADGVSANATSPSPNSSTTSARDSAEGLLELDVWNGTPTQSRQLVASASFQPRGTEPASVIQAWADHIFQPLV